MASEAAFEWTLPREDALVSLWDSYLSRLAIADALGTTKAEVDRKASMIGLDMDRVEASIAARARMRDMQASNRAKYRSDLLAERERVRQQIVRERIQKEEQKADRQRELARERNRRWRDANPRGVRAQKPADSVGKISSARPSDVFALQRANIMHLVDLKRAGHSPRRTELSLPTDEHGLRHFQRAEAAVSASGSPAAMCAGF